MATIVNDAHLDSTSVLSQLEHLATATTVFVSMPLVRGITPRVLIEKGQEENSSDGVDTQRYWGIFRPDEVGLPVFDHGLLYGDAVFEGVLVVGERLFKWREHLQRLYSSAHHLQLEIPYSPAALTKHVLETVRKTTAEGKTATYLRLVVTRGAGDLGIQPAKCSSGVVYCIASRIQENPEMGLSAYASEKEVAAYLDGLECPQAQIVPIAPDFVRNLFETIDSRRWPSLENFFSNEIIYERPGYAPLIGYDRVLKFYREERVITCGKHLLEEIVVDGDDGACWGRFIGEHKNGSQIDERFADAYKFENGRIKARKSYFFRPAV